MKRVVDMGDQRLADDDYLALFLAAWIDCLQQLAFEADRRGADPRRRHARRGHQLQLRQLGLVDAWRCVDAG